MGSELRPQRCIFSYKYQPSLQKIHEVCMGTGNMAVQSNAIRHLYSSKAIHTNSKCDSRLGIKARYKSRCLPGRLAHTPRRQEHTNKTYHDTGTKISGTGMDNKLREIAPNSHKEIHISRNGVRSKKIHNKNDRRKTLKSVKGLHDHQKSNKRKPSPIVENTGHPDITRRTSSTRKTEEKRFSVSTEKPQTKNTHCERETFIQGNFSVKKNFNLVDVTKIKGSFCSHKQTSTIIDSCNRCFNDWLGCPLRRQNFIWQVAPETSEVTHKCTRATSNNSSCKSTQTVTEKQDSNIVVRQYNSIVLHKERGGNTQQQPKCTNMAIADAMQQTEYNTPTKIHCNQLECTGRQTVKKGTGTASRMGTEPTSIQTNMPGKISTTNRLVCNQVELQTNQIHKSMPGQQGIRDQCVATGLECLQINLSVPTSKLSTIIDGQAEELQRENDINSTVE